MNTKMREIVDEAIRIRQLGHATAHEWGIKVGEIRNFFSEIDAALKALDISGDTTLSHTRERSVDHVESFTRQIFRGSSIRGGGYKFNIKAEVNHARISICVSATFNGEVVPVPICLPTCCFVDGRI